MMTADNLLLVFAQNNLMRHGNTRSPDLLLLLARAHGAGYRHKGGHFDHGRVCFSNRLLVLLDFHDRKSCVWIKTRRDIQEASPNQSPCTGVCGSTRSLPVMAGFPLAGAMFGRSDA